MTRERPGQQVSRSQGQQVTRSTGHVSPTQTTRTHTPRMRTEGMCGVHTHTCTRTHAHAQQQTTTDNNNNNRQQHTTTTTTANNNNKTITTVAMSVKAVMMVWRNRRTPKTRDPGPEVFFKMVRKKQS